MIALEIAGLSKTYGSVRALDGVDLTVEAGTVHCVLGENGAGKSTLCHAVGGSLTPSAGSMSLFGTRYAPRRPKEAIAAGVAMVHQHFSLVSTLTVAENLRLLRVGGLAARLERLADRYGLAVPLDETVGDLPLGVRQRVEIVKALLREPRLLVLDEPTGVLGPAEVDALLTTCRRIADDGGAVVLVTHKLGEVARVADVATVLRGGKVAGSGLTDLSADNLIPLMIGRPADDLAPVLAGTLGLSEVVVRDERAIDQAPVLSLRDISVTRPGGGYLLENVDLDIAPGEIVGVAGVEGNGQTELIHVLSGALVPDAGTVELAGEDLTRATPARRTAAGLGVVPEDRHHEGCVPELDVATNLYLGRLGEYRRFHVLLDKKAMRSAATAVIEKHGISAPGPAAPMSALSGGNQQKVVLARELALDPLVCLAAAQPTRGLDVGAVDAVLGRIRAAAAAGAAVLVVSSELGELLALCDRVVVAYRGKLSEAIVAAAPGAHDKIAHLMIGATA
ncbi:simple sugar transport system ATP-binding protein [Actinoplanes lutulentus]|uniref:Simple sugar transport system ATP-binding protein n=1 Tax=Actinoplanes lutulentus TaxID=1287878 RepID=A0A327Z1M9_9ACTN|nr:ATP-binding cassette domain-containing protein [Actinoplanes lutulentus]MBB2943069.1 simple sugar transport system ATP-binding protein [Actinoplanes lutulentus]RAK26665.1 simple sugar transport system ATP-binding protein [Actinoplanes lutulentus]